MNTFDEYGYFIECDIDVSIECHDYFNDLSFLSDQDVGVCSIEYWNMEKRMIWYMNERDESKETDLWFHSEEGIFGS